MSNAMNPRIQHFTDADLKMYDKMVKLLSNSVKFKDLDASEIIETSKCLAWFAKLKPQLEAFVLEYLGETSVAPEPPKE
jgi:hypothetical protein